MITLWKPKGAIAAIAVMSLVLLSCGRCSRSLEAQFFEAACTNDIGAIKSLLMLRVNVNARDSRGYSALMVVEACTAHTGPSRAEMVELLIANDAAVNLQARDGSDALMYAAGNGDTQAVKALLKSGASVKTADNMGETALMKAVALSCKEETIIALIEAGADLKATDHKGKSALSSPCLKGRLGDLLHVLRDEKDR